tara:strand:+ start:2290 stop:3564 length:1275 start_codon:yes stop_codon:yes gene_type:complete
MATVGSFVVNTYMNNENFMAGVKASQSAAKRMETGIGSSIDKINQKQLGNFGKSLLKGAGVISLVEAGAALATTFVKGFADGSLKTFPDVMKKFQETFETAIKNVPVAGAFFELGRAIQGLFNNADSGLIEWAKTEDAINKKILDDVNAIAKAKKDLNDIVSKQVQTDMNNDPSRSKAAKDQAEYQQKIVDSQKVREDAERKKELDMGNNFDEGKAARRQIADQQELNKLMDEYQKRRANNIAEQEKIDAGANAKDIIDNIKKRGSAELAIGHEKERFLQDMENELQLAVSLGAITKDQMDEALKYYAYVEGVTATRLAQEKKITDQIAEQKNLNDMIAESDEDQLRAQEDFDKTKAGLEEQAANLSSTTGVSSAIGDVKVAGAADFSIEKQLSLAQEALQAANDSVELLRIIADQAKTAGATT